MKRQWGVLVVEDEPVTQEYIVSLVNELEAFKLLGTCESVMAAVDAVREHQPDLLLLDVQLSDGTGFDLLDQIKTDNPPHVIFVTAYDQFAIQAFDEQAIDYLLKPFGKSRFIEALERADERLTASELGQSLESIIEIFQQRTPTERDEYIAFKADGETFLKRMSEIDWIESGTTGVDFHVDQDVFSQRETLTALESRLPRNHFVRIHKSTIVNLARIDRIEPWFHGDSLIFLKDGTQLKLSRRFRKKVESRLNIKL